MHMTLTERQQRERERQVWGCFGEETRDDELQRMYDRFVQLVGSLSAEEMQQETERAIYESRDAYIMEEE